MTMQPYTPTTVDIMPDMKVDGELFARWIEFLDASDRTIDTYNKGVKSFLRWMMSEGITQPRRADIVAYKRAMEKGHKATTVQNYLQAVKLFFQWTASENIYPNVAEHVQGEKVTKDHKRDYLTANQIKTILASIDTASEKGLRDYAMVALMVTCGLRTIEVQRANVGDLQTLGENTVLYVKGKSTTSRAEGTNDYVKVPPELETILRRYFAARGDSADASPLFTSTSNNNHGQRMTTRAISGAIKARMKAAGFDSERKTAHSLRHTAVTLARLSGKDLEEVQQFARHANIATTLIYDHAIEKSKNSCAAAVSAAILS